MRALLLAAVIAPSVAVAQTENPVVVHMRAYMDSDLHRNLVRRALDFLPPDVLPRCPALQGGATQVMLIKPITFAADGVPNGGVWRESFPVSGCGNDTTLHVFFTARPDEKIDTAVALPGDTLADPVLQNDAVRYADEEARLLIGGCTAFDVTNTTLATPAPPQKGAPWGETWTLFGCGKTAKVAMRFTPDATGTTIAVGPQ